MAYRPRGTFARTIYEKFHNDQFLDEYDKKLWYTLEKERLPINYQLKFFPLRQPDNNTKLWIERAKTQSGNIWLHIWHSIARSVLQFFMTQTDINGLLKRGSMFILSEHQFELLLEAGGLEASCNDVNVLDIGAGDGEITQRLLNSIEKISKNAKIHAYATEASWTMRERLKKKNFYIIENVNEIRNVQLISCLNVLDRCIDPLELLQDIYDALAPSGRVILALVLPYVHYVEFNSSHLPLHSLMPHWPEQAKQLSFEAEATIFFKVLEDFGFKIESWTKAPYLCEGDLRQSFYWLVDLVAVLSKKPDRISK